MNPADEKVTRFIREQFATELTSGATKHERHLAVCDAVSLLHIETVEGAYGCETGCEYARLTAQITCPHVEGVDFEYGTFGDLSTILAEIDEMEARRA